MIIRILLVLALLSGCAVSRVSGRMQLVSMSERQEAELGAELFAKLQESPGLIPPGPLVDHVRNLGLELATILEVRAFDYRFVVLDSPNANAFALPGGWVLITRGLLTYCNRDSELAGVLAHEIGHVIARHAASRAALAFPLDLLARAIAGAVSLISEKRAQAIRDKLPRMLVAPYTRRQEREADRVAVVLAASAGYDPTAFADLLLRAGGDRNSTAAPRTAASITTHPPTPERVALIEIISANLERGPPMPAALPDQAFLRLLDGVIIGPNPRHGRVVGTTLVVPDVRLAAVLPSGWATQSSPSGNVVVAPGGDAVLSLTPLVGDDPPLTELDGSEAQIEVLDPITSVHGTEITRIRFAVEEDGIAQVYGFRFGGQRFRLAGYWRKTEDHRWGPIARAVATSIRVASVNELARVEVTRLRVVKARPGETLAKLAQRTKSAWTPQHIAAVNDLAVDHTFSVPVLVKIAVREPYFTTLGPGSRGANTDPMPLPK